MNIKQLKARLAKINGLCSAIVTAADTDNAGAMTEEQTAEFDGLMAEYKQVDAQVSRLEALAAQTDHMQSSAGRIAAGAAPASPTPSAVVTDVVDKTGGFNSMAEFATVVRAASAPGGEVDSRLAVMGAPTNFHRESGAEEGYEVPPHFRDQVWSLMFGEDALMGQVDSEPTAGNSVEFMADETTAWGSTGIQAYWAGEGKKLDASKMETKGQQIKLHKLNAFVLASDELLSDAPRLASRLTDGAARAINWKANEAIVEGTGAGMPLGYRNSKALIAVAKESGQDAATVVAKNVVRMYSRMIDPARAVWRINSEVITELAMMTIGTVPIWTPPSAGFANAPGGFLLGRPIQLTELNEGLGTQGDIEFVNPKGYYCPIKNGGVQFATSIHLFFDYGLQAFRWTFRMGGQPYLSKPVAPNKGTATKSHFVALADRA